MNILSKLKSAHGYNEDIALRRYCIELNTKAEDIALRRYCTELNTEAAVMSLADGYSKHNRWLDSVVKSGINLLFITNSVILLLYYT